MGGEEEEEDHEEDEEGRGGGGARVCHCSGDAPDGFWGMEPGGMERERMIDGCFLSCFRLISYSVLSYFFYFLVCVL